jgi:hypothetical protein
LTRFDKEVLGTRFGLNIQIQVVDQTVVVHRDPMAKGRPEPGKAQENRLLSVLEEWVKKKVFTNLSLPTQSKPEQ